MRTDLEHRLAIAIVAVLGACFFALWLMEKWG